MSEGTPPVAEPGYTGPAPTDAEKSSAALAHYLNFIWIVPLIIYITKKDESAFVKYEAGKSLNFALTCLIASFIAGITVFCSPLALVIIIAQIILGIMQGGKVKAGQPTKYPWAFNFIK